MGVSRRILAVSVAALTAGGAFTANSPADAATSTHQRALSLSPVVGHASDQSAGAESLSTVARRAGVTDIREIVNQTQYKLWVRDTNGLYWIAPYRTLAGVSIWVPWVGNQGEFSKATFSIFWSDEFGQEHEYKILQDYQNPADQVMYTTNVYPGSPVPGSSTGAGRKRLIVRSDGSFFMENTS
jgi:hypothetical protein